MPHTSGQTLSSWPPAADPPSTAALTQDLTADVCIVGAGLAGLTTAYLLLREGRSVVVLDKGPVGGGNTGRTTAHLSNAFDDRYSELIRIHGEAKARLVAHSHSAAVDMIGAIAWEEGIDCDYERVSGYLFAASEDAKGLLDEELEAAHRAGLTEVAYLARPPLAGFEALPCLCFPDQGQFHPLKYLYGLARAIGARGGRIYTDTPVDGVQDGQPAQVRTRSGFTVTAEAVVVATNSPINDRVALHTKQAPYLSYVIAAEIPQGSIPRALYWDTEDPYHYVRLQTVRLQTLEDAKPGTGDTELLLVGGEDHKTGQADDAEARYGRLEAWARERFPEMREVRYRWSGQVYETLDGLALIGLNPSDRAVYVATGDSGMGMTHSTIAGMIIRDLITGQQNAWAAVYDPARKPLKAAGEFLKENTNVAAQYTDLLTPGAGEVADIALGSGAVVGYGPAKHAVYCDDGGALHARSAICTHLGCVVAWNSSEKTWDCPCHGSRFDAYGQVVNGPARSGLAAVEE
jgi:glycine/D-amino acid oxidase-like deaminating enzyme/nitrite reductase/ring-hydroxylating ferredoxin subunit